MKRIFLLLCLFALPLSAGPEKWWEAYNRGVKAVNARSYDAAVSALQKSIAEMPTESTGARAKNEIIVYVPHFWLGIAKFNTGDIDGALREFRISEEQGAIARTSYYAQLRDWVSRAQSEKARGAQAAAADSRKAADAALTKATITQAEALAAGGDRSETYRQASRKLQEALGIFQSAGADIKAFGRAADTAGQARDLFVRAADEARKQRASRPAQRPTQVAVTQPPVKPAEPPQVTVPVPQPPVQQPPVETKTEVAAVPSSKPKSEPTLIERMPDRRDLQGDGRMTVRAQLEAAYRAYAGGRFDASERTLNDLLKTEMSAEAYLLRGCSRYTRAVLSRNPEPLLAEARNDFKAALKTNRKLRLDKKAFSPKLVAFFEQVRKNG